MGFIYKRTLLSILLCLMSITLCWGQSTVSPGDLLIVGFNTDENSFTLLATRDIPAGTSFGVTDVGWINDQAGFKSGEGNLIWKGAAIAKGELIKEIIVPNYATSPTARFTLYGNFNLPASGDQFFVYRETPTLWVPIYGVNYRSRNWHAVATDAATSALPSALTLEGGIPLYVSMTLRKQYRYDQVIDLSNLTQLFRDVGNFRAWRGSNTNMGTGPEDFTFGKVTRLGPGDLSVIAINDGAVDEFTAVVFKDISAGTQFYFTDQGYKNGSLQESIEGCLTFKAPIGGLLAGQNIVYKANLADSNFYQTDQFEFSADGDQLFVYQQQGFIFGRNNRGSWGFVNSKLSNTSDLPAELQSTSYQYQDVMLDGNGYYIGPTRGTLAELLGFIADRSQWQFTGKQVALVPIFPRFEITGGNIISWLPSANHNYTITYVNRDSTNSTETQVRTSASIPIKVNTSIQYFDGLGRPSQKVMVGASPSYQDIVIPMAYDSLGRNAVEYEPYAAGGTNGGFRSTGIADQLTFYMNQGPTSSIKQTDKPFSVTKFQASPLSRVERQGFAGAVWQPVDIVNEHTLRTVYGINNVDTNYRSTGFAVRLYSANPVPTNGQEHRRVLFSNGFYQAGQLYLSITKDENWQVSDGKKGTLEEYKDKEGRIVLKRQFNEKAGTIEVLSTYYIYDDLGNLSFVLPPGTNPDGEVPNSVLQEQFCFQYHYDGEKRLIEQKIPAKGWEFIVYNQLGQLVLSQDAVQRTKGKWLFTKYDVFGRKIITGILSSLLSRNSLQIELDGEKGVHPLWESRSEDQDYTIEAFPRTYDHLLTVNYFDDYDFPGNNTSSFVPFSTNNQKSQKTKGLITGMKVRNLTTGVMSTTINYYDDHGRIVQVSAKNRGIPDDRIDTEYNFDGSVKSVKRNHNSGTDTTFVISRYEYDHMGRKSKNYQRTYHIAQIDRPEILISEVKFNDIGQVETKRLHNGLYTIANKYNERGWLSASHSNEFSLQLKYNDPEMGTVAQYNGNIANQIYENGGTNTFSYTYDPLDRLLKGAATGMIEELSYDRMDNIKSLERDNMGVKSYNYIGNQLLNFSGSTTYEYDGNGNAIKDGRTGIVFKYNHLNLPDTVLGNGKLVNYVYDAEGNKLQKRVKNGALTDLTVYADGIQYTGGNIDFIETDEGRAINNNGKYTYHYDLTDHLGNVRASFDIYNNAVRILQRDNYYPFGLRQAVIGGTNKYLYNGKELQEELGQYDYGARFYDPLIGRWSVVDALSDEPEQISKSPYAYAWNNPVKLTDPDGNCPGCIIGAGVGAVVGALFEIGSQLYKDGKISNWKAVGGSALQGAITGGVAGATGGASLLVNVGANAGANIVGGIANRTIQGKETTASDVAVDGVLGGAFAAAGKVIGNLTKKAADNLSNSAKGKLGETVTEVKYGFLGYRSQSKAIVETGAKTATGKEQVAKFDFSLKNIFTKKIITVESKFNTSGLTRNQVAARSRVTTAGGLIVDRTTSSQLGKVAQSVVTGAGGQKRR